MRLSEKQAKEYLQGYMDSGGDFYLHHKDAFTNRKYLVSKRKMIRHGQEYVIYVEIRQFTGFDPLNEEQTKVKWGIPSWYMRRPGELFEDARKSLSEAIRLLSTADLED